MQPLTSYVTTVENVDRIDHRDGEGGGSIIRTMYIEPYSSYPWVINALKGTIKNNGDGTYSRVKPHYDPLSAIVQNAESGSAKTQGFFYCTDTKVIPFAKEAVRGSKSSGFIPSEDLSVSIDPSGVPDGNNQLANLFAAFNNVDDFDMAANPDTLTTAEIRKGAPDYSKANGSAAFISEGNCGAFVTATYTPILFMPGIQSDPAKPNYQDPFDYVDPQWQPETKLTQMGQDLQFFAINFAHVQDVYGGVKDTQTIPELIWNFSIRRLMVPQIPMITLSLLANKVNKTTQSIGNLKCPAGCLKMGTPETIVRRAPDGTMFFDLLLRFQIRMLWEEYYALNDVDSGPGGAPKPNGMTRGWVDWNHQLGILTTPNNVSLFGGIRLDQLTYWPIGWTPGLFQFFGESRLMFLRDSDAAASDVLPANGPGGAVNMDLTKAPFSTGFALNQ